MVRETAAQLADLQHEAVLHRITDIKGSTTEADAWNTDWYQQQAGRPGFLQPVVVCTDEIPVDENLDMAWIRSTKDFPAPVSNTGSMFQSARELLHHARRGMVTLPRTKKHKDPKIEEKKDRLRACKTRMDMDVLLEVRMHEIRNSNMPGSDANEMSKFMKWRHFVMELGLRPIRWRFKTHKDDTAAMKEEINLLKKFVAFGSLFWGAYETMAQAVSAVRSIHKKMGIDLPELKEVMDLLHDSRKRMNMESGGRTQRDEFENFEMDAIQDAALVVALEIGARIEQKLNAPGAKASNSDVLKQMQREYAHELGMMFTAAVQRLVGNRPGEILPGEVAFRSFWGGSRGEQLHWTKRHLRRLASIPDGCIALISPAMTKSWFTTGPKVKQQKAQKKAVVALPGEMGRRGVVQIARLLLAADTLQLCEDEEDVPIVRDPPQFGGTGKCLVTEDFNVWTKKRWAPLRVQGDCREHSAYSWKRSISNCMGNTDLGGEAAAASAPFASSGGSAAAPKHVEHRKRLHGQHSSQVVMIYDEQDAVEVAMAAFLATGARYSPMSACGTEMADDLQATAFGKVLQQGWRTDSLESARRSAICEANVKDARPALNAARLLIVDVSLEAEDHMQSYAGGGAHTPQPPAEGGGYDSAAALAQQQRNKQLNEAKGEEHSVDAQLAAAHSLEVAAPSLAAAIETADTSSQPQEERAADGGEVVEATFPPSDEDEGAGPRTQNWAAGEQAMGMSWREAAAALSDDDQDGEADVPDETEQRAAKLASLLINSRAASSVASSTPDPRAGYKARKRAAHEDTPLPAAMAQRREAAARLKMARAAAVGAALALAGVSNIDASHPNNSKIEVFNCIQKLS